MANTGEITIKKKGLDPRKIAAIAALAVVVIAVALSFLPGLLKPKVEVSAGPAMGNSQGNLGNGGTLVLSGKDVYLSDPTQEGRIVKCALGSAAGTPVGDLKGSFLNVDGGTLYFVDGETGRLMSAKLDGSNVQVALDRRVTSLKLSDGFLYYLDVDNGSTLCRMAVQDIPSGKTTLLGDARVMQYAFLGDRVFMQDLNQDSQGIYMNPDGSDPRTLQDLRIGPVLFSQGRRLFFSNPDEDGALDFIWLNDENKFTYPAPLNTDILLYAVADDDYLYYVKAEDGLMYALRYSAAGGVPQAMTQTPVYGLQIAGDYIYYNETLNEGAVGCVQRLSRPKS